MSTQGSKQGSNLWKEYEHFCINYHRDFRTPCLVFAYLIFYLLKNQYYNNINYDYWS